MVGKNIFYETKKVIYTQVQLKFQSFPLSFYKLNYMLLVKCCPGKTGWSMTLFYFSVSFM